MALRLVIGGAHSGKSRLLAEPLYAAVTQRGTGALLVPSDPDVSRAVARASAYVSLGLAITTFDDYLDGLWEQVGDGRTIATPVQRVAVLEESVRSWRPRVIAAPVRSRGIIAMLELLAQRAAEAESFAAVVPRITGEARDLLDCLMSYQRLLAASGLLERAEAHRVAVAQSSLVALPDMLCVDGFTGLTPAQEAFVLAASKRAEVMVSLTFNQATPATSAAAALVERLSEAGEVRVANGRPRELPPELERIRESLGSTGSADVAPAGNVILSEAWGQEAEAARICGEAQAAIADGIEPSAIAVVFRDAGEHMSSLGRAFREAGIEVTFDARVPFRTAPLGRVLVSLLKFDSLTHGQLLDVLRSPYSPTPHELLDEFDAHERGGSGATKADPIRWFARRHPETAVFLRMVRGARDERADNAESRWHGVVSQMLQRSARTCLSDESFLMDAATTRVFMDAIAGIAAVGNGRVDPSTLTAVLDNASVALNAAEDGSAVRVMSAERARGGAYACVILGGLTEHSFPRRTRADALTEPALLGALQRANVDMSQRSGVDDERLLFYQVVTRATERLVLSRQAFNADGASIRSSIFLEELLDLYRDPVTHQPFAGEVPVRRLGLDGLAAHPQAPVTERRALRSGAGSDSGEPRVGEARRRARLRPPSLSAAAQRVMAERTHFSASEIEAYLRCPYFWCVQRLVRPDELDERADQAAMGRLGHEIMRRFYERFTESTGLPRVTPDALDVARRVHLTVSEECMREVRTATAAEEAACRAIVRRTLRVVESDAEYLPGFDPIAHEWSFGMSDDDPGEDFQSFRLRGRIDRIDRSGTLLVVSDYKSGAIGAEHGAGRLVGEGVVQLPLYAAVAARRLKGEAAAILYRSLKGGKPRGVVGPDVAPSAFVRTDVVGEREQLQAHIAAAVEQAAGAVARMREGDIKPDPLGGTCPSYCSAWSYCERWSGSRG